MSQGAIPQQIYCRHCGQVINRDQQICPHCGVRNQYARTGGVGQAAGQGPTMFGKNHDLASQSQVIEGLKFGVGAYFVGLILTTLLVLANAMSFLNNLRSVLANIPAVAVAVGGGAALESPVMAAAKFFVWVFYSGQMVGVTAQGSAAGFGRQASRTTSNNVVTALGQAGVLNPLLFQAIPALLLVSFGYRAARSTGYDEIYEKAAGGASVVVGYLPLGILGALFASIGFSVGGGFGGAPSAGASVGLSVGQAFLFFALYAVLFGAAGGTIRGLLE